MSLDHHTVSSRGPSQFRWLLTGCVFAWACTANQEVAPYRVGVVLDGDGMRGARIASTQLDSRGGIDGHPIVLVSAGGAGSTLARVALETAERLAMFVIPPTPYRGVQPAGARPIRCRT